MKQSDLKLWRVKFRRKWRPRFPATLIFRSNISGPHQCHWNGTYLLYFSCWLEKEMATHSSILAWRILWTEETCGLLSMGSHRVGHDWSDLACMHALEREMATHSSVPGTKEPGGLPSMGLHRVGHNWSDLAAAAAAYICLFFSLSLSQVCNIQESNNFVSNRWEFSGQPARLYCHVKIEEA